MKELIRVRVRYASRQQCCKTYKRPLPFFLHHRRVGKLIGSHRLNYVAFGYTLLLRLGIEFMEFGQFFKNFQNKLTMQERKLDFVFSQRCANNLNLLRYEAISIDMVHTVVSEGIKIYGVQDELLILDC